MSEQPPNPYVGPRAFQLGETLYGRDREARDLLNLLIAERVVLLYSPSGAGKTSLINAALIPRLINKDFQVLPSIRVNAEIPSEMAASWGHVNRFVLSMLMSLEEGLSNKERMPAHELIPLSVSEYLRTYRRRRISDPVPVKVNEAPDSGPLAENSAHDEVLIFDQFEEIITADPANVTDRVTFFDQLGEALFDRGRWALFAMREDFIATLDPYLGYLPTYLQNTFRLDLLDHEAARAAMQEPARRGNFVFTDKAARKLANDLSRVYARSPNGELVPKAGPYIEPVQLQVVCYRLWKPGIKAIHAENIASIGDVDEVLADYYDDCVADSARASHVSERAIRDWFDHELITQNIRGRVMAGSKECKPLTEPAIQRLIDAHIIRAEELRGATWYELAHDRLIEPVQKSNAEWCERNLSALQRQADWWVQQHRSDDLTMRGAALAEADQWAQEHAAELTDVERDFLDTCHKTRAVEQRERRNNRLMRGLAVAASIGLVLAIIGVVATVWQAGIATREANNAKELTKVAQTEQKAAETARTAAEAARVEAVLQHDVASSRQLAAQAISSMEPQPDLAMLLSLEAQHITDTVEARSGLLTGLQASRYISASLRGEYYSIASLAINPYGHILAAAANDEIVLWDIAAQRPIGLPLTQNKGWISTLAFNNDGTILAAGGCALYLDEQYKCLQGEIQLWDVSNPWSPVLLGPPLTDHTDTVWSVAFRPDGKTLASGSGDKTIRLWDVSNPQAPVAFGTPLTNTDFVSSVAFSPDGKTLASNGCGHYDPTSELCNQGEITLWNVSNPQAPLSTTLTGHNSWVMSVAISPDGKKLASGSDDGSVIVWDLRNGVSRTLTGNGPSVVSVVFSPDGSTLATSSQNDSITLWDLSHQPTEPQRMASGNFSSLAFVSDSLLASGGADNGTVTLWNTKATESPFLLLATIPFTNPVRTVTFSRDGKQMAVGQADGAIDLIDLTNESMLSRSGFNIAVNSVALSSDGSLLAAGEETGAVLVWDVKTHELITDTYEYTGPVTSVAFSPQGNLLVSGGDDRVTIWDVSNRQNITKVDWKYPGSSQVTGVVFNADGTKLAVGSDDPSIILLEVSPDKKELPQVGLPLFGEHTSSVKSMAFSPDDKWLASADADGNIILWNFAASPPLGHKLIGTKDAEIASLAFSPKGNLLASAGCGKKHSSVCSNGTVRLWDVASYQALGQGFTAHTDRVDTVAFYPDGKHLVAGGEDKLLTIWDVDPESWRNSACTLAGRNLRRTEWEQYFPDQSYDATCRDSGVPLYFYEATNQADAYALTANNPDAAAAFSRALQIALQTESASLNNYVCWTGSIDGFAQIVLPACERAVELAPEDGTSYLTKSWYRDSRGLAYAITGNYARAVADFEALVDWAGKHKGMAARGETRKVWIKALQECITKPSDCHNPFNDRRTLESFRND